MELIITSYFRAYKPEPIQLVTSQQDYFLFENLNNFFYNRTAVSSVPICHIFYDVFPDLCGARFLGLQEYSLLKSAISNLKSSEEMRNFLLLKKDKPWVAFLSILLKLYTSAYGSKFFVEPEMIESIISDFSSFEPVATGMFGSVNKTFYISILESLKETVHDDLVSFEMSGKNVIE